MNGLRTFSNDASLVATGLGGGETDVSDVRIFKYSVNGEMYEYCPHQERHSKTADNEVQYHNQTSLLAHFIGNVHEKSQTQQSMWGKSKKKKKTRLSGLRKFWCSEKQRDIILSPEVLQAGSRSVPLEVADSWKDFTASKPHMLLGWQIMIQSDNFEDIGIAVVTGIRKNWKRQTEFRVSTSCCGRHQCTCANQRAEKHNNTENSARNNTSTSNKDNRNDVDDYKHMNKSSYKSCEEPQFIMPTALLGNSNSRDSTQETSYCETNRFQSETTAGTCSMFTDSIMSISTSASHRIDGYAEQHSSPPRNLPTYWVDQLTSIPQGVHATDDCEGENADEAIADFKENEFVPKYNNHHHHDNAQAEHGDLRSSVGTAGLAPLHIPSRDSEQQEMLSRIFPSVPPTASNTSNTNNTTTNGRGANAATTIPASASASTTSIKRGSGATAAATASTSTATAAVACHYKKQLPDVWVRLKRTGNKQSGGVEFMPRKKVVDIERKYL